VNAMPRDGARASIRCQTPRCTFAIEPGRMVITCPAPPSTSYWVTSQPSACTTWATNGSVGAPLITCDQNSSTGNPMGRASVPSTYQ